MLIFRERFDSTGWLSAPVHLLALQSSRSQCHEGRSMCDYADIRCCVAVRQLHWHPGLHLQNLIR